MEWFKYKRYPHLDLPFEWNKIDQVVSYVENPLKIASHAFLPLIRRNVVSRPYRRKENKDGVEVSCPQKKVREITYASHIDAAVYSYYGFELSEKYELFLKSEHLDDVVSAYRKIPCDDKHGNKCNIELANDVFKFVREKLDSGQEVSVITFDIKGFFDNLDHKIVKSTWKQMFGCDSMTNSTYAVYKSVTNYSYIYENELFDFFKDRIVCERSCGVKKKKVKRLIYMRDKKAVAFCVRDSIHELRKAHIIRTRSKSLAKRKGIPQGLPISAVLANVYMCNFDKEISKNIQTFGGLYRRYSDDIVIVCPLEYGNFWKDWMIMSIEEVNLCIEKRKTNLYNFVYENGKILCKHETKREAKKMEYLGFSFDGNKVLIKDTSLGHYYSKMAKAIMRCKTHAVHINNPTLGDIFENQLIKRFSYAGSKTHRIFKRSKINPSLFYLVKNKRSYGNYITYVKKASIIMNEPAIIKQMRRNKNKLRLQIKLLHSDVDSILMNKRLDQIQKYNTIYK